MIEGIIAGAVAGAGYGIISFVKNRKEDDWEEFDWNLFIPSVVGSAVIGGYAYYAGGAIDVVASSAIGVVVTQAVRKLWAWVRLKIGY